LQCARAKAAVSAYRESKLAFRERNYRFVNRQYITVNWSNGKEDYIFDKIDWVRFSKSDEPVIFATPILKTGKKSKSGSGELSSTIDYLYWDSLIVVSTTEPKKT
jgi:hypothetical protein